MLLVTEKVHILKAQKLKAASPILFIIGNLKEGSNHRFKKIIIIICSLLATLLNKEVLRH